MLEASGAELMALLEPRPPEPVAPDVAEQLEQLEQLEQRAAVPLDAGAVPRDAEEVRPDAASSTARPDEQADGAADRKRDEVLQVPQERPELLPDVAAP